MKRITLLGSMVILLLFTCVAKAQDRRPFHIIPLVPVVGQDVKFTYDNSLTSLAGEQTVHGTVYSWQDTRWEAQDLKLVKNDTAWEATWRVPSQCALVVCKFYAGDKKDTGGKATYATMTFDKDGRNLPSAYMAWGMLRNKTLESLPGYCDEEAYIDDEVMRFWLNQQLLKDPGARKYVCYYAAKFLNKVAPGEKHEQMIGDVDYVMNLPLVDEETLLKALEVARDIVRDTTKAAEVEKKILTDYPDGILARDKEIWKLFRESDLDGKEAKLDAFLQRFPTEKFKDVETETTQLYYGKIFQSVVYNRVMKKDDYSGVKKYLKEVPFTMLPTFYWHIVQVPLNTGQAKVEKVLPHGKLIFEEFITRERRGNDRVYSPAEWAKRLRTDFTNTFLGHAIALAAAGESEEALSIMEEVKGAYNFKSAEFNDLYVRLLEKNGYSSLVIPTIVASVRENAVSPEMLDRLRKDYLTKNKDAEGFDAYVNSLKSKEQTEEMHAKLKGSLIKEKIDLFTLENLDGKKVDLGKMKGKIIVLDFWATWCSPCKASLPGMQMAVNKYKNDPNVGFYFISTMETASNYREKIREFLKEKNYSLDVLCDNVNPKTKKQDAIYEVYSKAFKFSGIPHKMIIDGNGYLRWSSNGYFGSPSALAEEIGFIIDMLKAEK